jgi:hypothetical protein
VAEHALVEQALAMVGGNNHPRRAPARASHRSQHPADRTVDVGGGVGVGGTQVRCV